MCIQTIAVMIPPAPSIIKIVPTMRLSMISPLRLKYFRSRETSRVIKVHHNSAPSAMEIIPTISDTLHPVGRSQIHIFFAFVVEIPYAAVFQISIHNTGNGDVFTVRLVGNQSAYAPYNQIDFHTRFTCPV